MEFKIIFLIWYDNFKLLMLMQFLLNFTVFGDICELFSYIWEECVIFQWIIGGSVHS